MKNRNTKSNPMLRIAMIFAVTAAAVLPAQGKGMKLEIAPSSDLLLAGQKQTAWVKVGLTAVADDLEDNRPPVNLCIVLDKSGSMQGEKIDRAREAAAMIIERLRADDIISVVAYDSNVHVIVPATKATDRQPIIDAIRRIEAGSNTALFAGVSKGTAEVRKFLAAESVNRVILLSDGLANVGPSSPGELGQLGESLLKEGVAVTTIGLGLGYNEDLMAALAEASDGNHAFVENAVDLARVFDRELGSVMQVVAQDIDIRIRCRDGVRPVRVIGRDIDIKGDEVVTKLNQLYNDWENYIVLEVEVPATEETSSMEIASVDVSWRDMASGERKSMKARADVKFTDSAAVAEASVNKKVMVPVVSNVAIENNEKAMALRDEGKVEEARQALLSNSQYILDNNQKYGDEQLQQIQAQQEDDAKNLNASDWTAQRKIMKESQLKVKLQRK